MSAIKVVDYDPAWPGLFEEEKSRLLEVIGDIAEDVHHVGSTSVVGLCAKPKIDIDAVLRGNPIVAEAIERVKSLADDTSTGILMDLHLASRLLWHAALSLRAWQRHARQTHTVSRLASHPSRRRC
jgi:GrpB-like predicted nucleotidyltransferase (UPF0157 family)